jgi:hypothetical protein
VEPLFQSRLGCQTAKDALLQTMVAVEEIAETPL